MNSIGRVVSVSYDRLIFEVSDFEKLIYNFKGEIYIAQGVIDYVTIKSQFGDKFVYQVVRVEDKEIKIVNDEKSKFDYVGRFECVPVGILENDKISFNLKKYPFLQDRVYLSSDEDLQKVFSIENRETSILLGTIQDKYDAQINLNKLITHHSAILGNTGSGKSTTVRKIIKEIATKETSNLYLNIFDIHNEYSQIDGVNNIDVLEDFSIKIESLELQDWLNLIKPSELVQLPVVQTALKLAYCLSEGKLDREKLSCFIAYNLYHNQQSDAVAKRSKIIGILAGTGISTEKYNSQFGNFSQKDEQDFKSSLKSNMYVSHSEITKEIENARYTINSFADLFEALNFVFLLEECQGNTQARGYSATLETRIKHIQFRYGGLFKVKKEDSGEVAKQSKITVYNVSGLDDDLLLFFTTYMLKKEFKNSSEKEIKDRDVNLFIFEEAHRYISKLNENSLFGEVEVFKKIAREGRKFGCFLLLSSQRPSELSSTVLSQCNNYLIHRIKNNVDLEYLLKTIPYINKNQLTRFSYLPTGTAFIVGELYPIPVEVAVDGEDEKDITVTPQVKFKGKSKVLKQSERSDYEKSE
ncbi:ATP-binding protein [Streptococcus oralis]|uniref:Type IV secretory pathway, VirB4 components n=1 Tax=Streptococcus oralis TaxID=1303 RepID=A0A4V0E8B2_STROR|nr:ATP-binding protein [Streptococcus oralis]VTT04058.1 Type IV secretory pathway, VirB4 components [Streptococcus oralis]